MRFLGAIRKRRAIRSYASKLPKMLRDDYGFSRTYAPRQIRATIERNGLNQYHSCYAISMFSDRSDFAQYHESIGEICDYDMMRAEVAANHFHGDVDFTVSDIMHAFPDAFHDAGVSLHGGTDGHGGSGDAGASH
jgi:hypothetical protein